MYFTILRPPLLPEDVRHTGVDPTALPPAFLDWLGIVFATWGGFIAGFGIVLVGIGAFMLSTRTVWVYLGTAVGVLVAFGRFVVSNIILNSDFLWFIATMFVLAVVVAVVLLVTTVHRLRSQPDTQTPTER